MPTIDKKYLQLKLTDEYLTDPLLMAMAWKKSHEYIRTTNWYADNFELDKSSLNLQQCCEQWITSISTKIPFILDLKFKKLELVPAPKSHPWDFYVKNGTVGNEQIRLDQDISTQNEFCLEWKPVDPDDVKLRPLAHIPIKEQSIMTLVMMCLANQVETLQGNPSTKFKDVHNNGVVSYGNRLYCNYDSKGKAEHSFGATTIYSKYFTDYRMFLQRPYYFANKKMPEISPDEDIYLIELDLKQFFDLINRKTLIEKISDIVLREQGISSLDSENTVMNVFKEFESWEWSEQAKQAYFLCGTNEVKEARNDGLPQGLVASGFLSNIYLLDFDSQMKKMIGESIPPTKKTTKEVKNHSETNFNIKVIDYCRYVDDMRLVVVGPNRKKLKSNPLNFIKAHVSSFFESKLTPLGLMLNDKKIKIEIYRGRPVGVSATLESIQSKASGPISMEDADEQLNQLESLLVLSNITIPDQRGDDCSINRLALIEKDIFDVREDTLKRFAANKITRMLASKRHFTARECNDAGQPIPCDWDYLQERMARRLMSCWSHDPSIVLLLKKSLELFPCPKLLEPALEQLDYLLSKENHEDIRQKKQSALAKYCMSEIFRHAASVIHCKDRQTIPAHADINGFFELLQNKAASLIINENVNTKITDASCFNLLVNQARFLLMVRADSVLDFTSGNIEQDLILKIIKGYRSISFPTHLDAQSVATCILLASQLAVDQKPVLRATACLLAQENIAFLEILKRIAIQDAALFKSLIRHVRSLGKSHLEYNWIYSADVKEIIEQLYVDARASTKTLEDINESMPIFSLSSRSDNPFANEIMALRLMQILLSKANELKKSDDKLISLSRTTIKKQNGYSVPPRIIDFDDNLDLKLGFCRPIMNTASHIKMDNTDTGCLQRIALCIRAVLAGTADPTGFGKTIKPRIGYRGIKSTQYKRQFGMITTPESLVGENAQFSTWLTTLLSKLLRWPGIQINNQGYEWTNDNLSMENVKKLVSDRLAFLKNRYCVFSELPGLPEMIKPDWTKDKTTLTVAMVQSKLPFEGDFIKHGLALDTPEYRAKHRRHVARVASLVVGHIEAQHIEKTKNGIREQDIDLIIWPELAVHKDDVDILIHLSQKTHAIVFAGLGFINQSGIKGPNNCAIWIVPKKHTGNRNEIKRYQGKQNMMKGERNLNIQPWRPYQLLLELVHPSYPKEPGFILTGSICFDATDIALSADLRDKSSVLIIPALNKDVNTFDSMVDALHYHMFQHVVLVNSGEFGGSYARAPYKEPHKRLIAHSTGNNQVSINTFEMNMFDFRRDGIGKSKRSGNEFKTSPAGVTIKDCT